MLDPETFLTELYVLADEFGKQERTSGRPPGRSRGPVPALHQAELLTLALFSQWQQFPSEAAFYRWASKHLRPLFPRLPSRPQFNRQVRHAEGALTAFALQLGSDLAAVDRAYEVVDGTGIRVRNAKRRGEGWLAGLADIGSCSRLGWYEGLRLLLSVTPRGAITGWGIGPASTNDRVLAETFFAARATPHPRLPGVGQPVSDRYVADMGFSGRACEARWRQRYGAVLVAPPHPRSRQAWSKPWKRWLAGIRQIIETVNDRLLTTFGLDAERPHALDGLQARLAAAMGLHNVCCWLNRKHGRPDLAVADLIDW
jgi:hypothetical protein